MGKCISLPQRNDHEMNNSSTICGYHVRDKLKETALTSTVKDCHTECVMSLIKAGAGVNKRNKLGQAPLHCHTLCGRGNITDHFSCVEMLVDAGSDVNIRDKEKHWGGRTPLIFAVETNHYQCVDLLIHKGADVNAIDKQRNTALTMAATKNNLTCVQKLIAAGADVNVVPNIFGYTPFMVACNSGDYACMNVLIKAGADVNHGNKDGWKPLDVVLLRSALGVYSYL